MQKPNNLVLFLTAKIDRDYDGRRRLDLQGEALSAEDWPRLRGLGYGDDAAFDGLTVSAAAADDMGPGTYGWATEYKEARYVKLDQAERMVKVLRKVERGLAKLTERYGYPEFFTAYLLRVADVLGITQFAIRQPSGDLTILSVTSAAYWLDEQVRDFHKEDEA